MMSRCTVLLLLLAVTLCRCATASAIGEPVAPEISRPETDPAFLRLHAPVVTVRITGEEIRATQISVYRDGSTVRALIRQADQRASSGYSERTSSSTDVGALKSLYDSFPSMQVSAFPEDTLYFPAMGVEIWATGIAAESRFSMRLPNDAAQSAAYWGERNERNTALLRWVRSLLDALAVGVR